MRHNKKFNHLGRKHAHRELMLSNMACSLIMHKRIVTTVAKAKALRIYVEPIITRSKADSTHARRMAFADLRDKYAVTELFREVSPRIMDRPGGYTRIVRLGERSGDNAEVCLMELVDFNEMYSQGKGATRKATRRSSHRAGVQTVAVDESREKSSSVEPADEAASQQ